MSLLGLLYSLSLSAALLILLTLIIWKYSTRNFNYWRDRGVPYPEPLPFIGNFLEVFAFRLSLGKYLEKIYNEFKAPYFGIFVFNKPCLFIKCPELIKSITVTNFNYCPDRNLVCDEESDPIVSQFLAFMNNPEWKQMRIKITPVFSTAKIKNMSYLTVEVADEMVNYIEKNLNKGPLEAKEISSKFTTDVIASCAFGIKAHCFDNEYAEFRQIGKKMFDFNWKTAITQACYFLSPGLVKFFKLRFFDASVNDFTRKVFWQTVEERKKSNVKRHDIIDVINQIREESITNDDIKFDGDRVVAQAALFFAAGFETCSTTIAFALYELCLHSDIQNEARQEIKKVLSCHGGITYEALQDLKYMTMVIYETMRKYPALPFIDRISVEDFTLPNTNIVVEKGTSLFVSLLGLHNDPEFFPYPEKFDPERFAVKNKENVCYLPFGDGPRACIGTRFAMMEMKIALVRILSEFELERSIDTPASIQFSTKCFLLGSEAGLFIKFKKLV